MKIDTYSGEFRVVRASEFDYVSGAHFETKWNAKFHSVQFDVPALLVTVDGYTFPVDRGTVLWALNSESGAWFESPERGGVRKARVTADADDPSVCHIEYVYNAKDVKIIKVAFVVNRNEFSKWANRCGAFGRFLRTP